MAYRITRIELAHFPNAAHVAEVLMEFGLPEQRIIGPIQDFICNAPLVQGQGYQKILSSRLENHLRQELIDDNDFVFTTPYYSPNLNERGDLAILKRETDTRVFVEIEFRPNVEKDLIKFQIGHNNGRLVAAVLILAIDRLLINPTYHTMPEFSKAVRIVEELTPEYPLLVVGVAGEHIDI